MTATARKTDAAAAVARKADKDLPLIRTSACSGASSAT